MHIRLATENDLDAIDAIYNHYVQASTCTYQYVPSPRAERLAWFRAHDAEHPITVVEDTGEIVGYGSLSRFRDREGYRFTVEDTVYVRADRHRRGVGRAVIADLIERAQALGHRTIIAGVSAEQEASLALHRAFGFVECARFRQVGFKFDTWLDCVFLQRMLA